MWKWRLKRAYENFNTKKRAYENFNTKKNMKNRLKYNINTTIKKG